MHLYTLHKGLVPILLTQWFHAKCHTKTDPDAKNGINKIRFEYIEKKSALFVRRYPFVVDLSTSITANKSQVDTIALSTHYTLVLCLFNQFLLCRSTSIDVES